MKNQYELLARPVLAWIHKQKWQSLKPIQLEAIAPILSCKQDILISASTASGKTEAAFLPAISRIIAQDDGIGILYISPLKALINDQYRRLEDLCELADIKVTAWHGDSSASKKKQTIKSPSGIILITPESLEALLMNNQAWAAHAFKQLKYIIIDEFHSFIGTERGLHLLSLLHRVEHVTDRLTTPIVRIALSATLGDIHKVPALLRPNNSLSCLTIQDKNATLHLKVKVNAYKIPRDIDHKNEDLYLNDIAKALYDNCRGTNNLVFANSRGKIELYSAMLRELCETASVPNEFFPHHGSLAKDLRESLEKRLQESQYATTAICSSTLELGIDIGKVESVIQIDAPFTVSSLRQRIGRSGRRNAPAILNMLITENELELDSSIVDKLRLNLIQSIAMIRLIILSKWFEPADTQQYHLSTLIHQILAIIAQYGSARIDQLYIILCKEGPFKNIDIDLFKLTLTSMHANELIAQLASGELMLGMTGEKICNHYSFFAVFSTPIEYRIICESKTLGTLPVSYPLVVNQPIIFAGKRWKVIDFNKENKCIYVKPSVGGKPPNFFGSSLTIHDVVRQEMYNILTARDYRITHNNQMIDFISTSAKSLFQEAVEFFHFAKLETNHLFANEKYTYIIPWLGDKTVNAITLLLQNEGLIVQLHSGVIEIEAPQNTVIDSLKKIASSTRPVSHKLAINVVQKVISKFDDVMSDELLCYEYSAKALDVDAAIFWIKKHFLNT